MIENPGNSDSEGDQPDDSLTLPVKGQTFRGGSKRRRDSWYGYNDPDFQRWWHRSPDGKRSYGGRDIESADEARQIYEDWILKGKPVVK